MKRIFTVMMVIGLAVCLAATAGAGLLQPRADGNNVLVPDALIKAIPGYDGSKSVFAACDVNGWFVGDGVSADIKSATEIKKVGADWMAPDMRGVRFHPVQLKADGKPAWAKVEALYPLNAPFVDMSTGSPCLLVK